MVFQSHHDTIIKFEMTKITVYEMSGIFGCPFEVSCSSFWKQVKLNKM